MKELNTVQSAIFALGAFLMVLGVAGVVTGFLVQPATICFTIGSIAFALMQLQQSYEGNSITIKRLRRIMVIGDIAFVLAGLLMFENNFRLIYPFVATSIDGYNNWIHYVYNNWVVMLLIAAILEMYTTHRISYELKKEEKKQDA